MEELNIQLNYDPNHFRELYYKNGQGSVFTYMPTKNSIIITALLVLITIVIYFFSLNNSSISWLLILGSIAILFSLAATIVVIIKHQKWKNSFEEYLKKISLYQTFKISLTSKSIEVTLDSSGTIENWETIKMVQLEQDYVSLKKEAEQEVYFFPAKAMTQDEFEKLKVFIREKVK